MFKKYRTRALAAVLLASLVAVLALNGTLRSGTQAVVDFFDKRPVRSVLFIGNSRTFYNDMPAMVRSIADSAGSPERLRIKMYAYPRATLEGYWDDPTLRALIAKGWDNVILQAQSSAQYSEQTSGQVWKTAANFIAEVRSIGAQPAMYVTWRYTDQCPKNLGMPPAAFDLPPSGYANMHINIQLQHEALARTTGVDLVNVGKLWESMQNAPLNFPLYSDCNHPTVYGSYLAALMFDAYLRKGNVADVTYRPDTISPEDASFIKKQVADFLNQSAGG